MGHLHSRWVDYLSQPGLRTQQQVTSDEKEHITECGLVRFTVPYEDLVGQHWVKVVFSSHKKHDFCQIKIPFIRCISRKSWVITPDAHFGMCSNILCGNGPVVRSVSRQLDVSRLWYINGGGHSGGYILNRRKRLYYVDCVSVACCRVCHEERESVNSWWPHCSLEDSQKLVSNPGREKRTRESAQPITGVDFVLIVSPCSKYFLLVLRCSYFAPRSCGTQRRYLVRAIGILQIRYPRRDRLLKEVHIDDVVERGEIYGHLNGSSYWFVGKDH